MADAFDRFVEGTRQVFNTVADATVDLFEKGKGYVNTKQVEWKLREAYRAFGRMQYRAELGEAVDEAEKQKLVTEISDALDALKKAGGSETDGGKYEFVACANCEQLAPKGAAFCPNCGAKME